MLKSNERVAVYMEGHIDSDYGKMGTGVVRYLKNPIIGVIDKTHAGKSMTDFIDIEREIHIIKKVLLLMIRTIQNKIKYYHYLIVKNFIHIKSYYWRF